MMFGLEAIALVLLAGSTSTVGDWKVTCVDTAKLEDGKFDQCTMTKKESPLSVEIVRTAEGTATSLTQKGCKPPSPVAPSTRTQEQLAAEGGNKMLLGSVVENLMKNQQACRARGGALIIPITEPEATQLLAATSAIRGL